MLLLSMDCSYPLAWSVCKKLCHSSPKLHSRMRSRCTPRVLCHSSPKLHSRVRSRCTPRVSYLQFEALLAENEARPESERLPRSAFEIDVGLREMVAVETQQREADARLEMAWETEKRRLALAKLRDFFLDRVRGHGTMLACVRLAPV